MWGEKFFRRTTFLTFFPNPINIPLKRQSYLDGECCLARFHKKKFSPPHPSLHTSSNPAGAEVDGSMADERASGASAGKTQAEFHRAEFAARGRERFNLSLADDEVR